MFLRAGVVTTEIWDRKVSLMTPVQLLVAAIGITPLEGSTTLAWLASDPNVVSDPENWGAYFDREWRRNKPGCE